VTTRKSFLTLDTAETVDATETGSAGAARTTVVSLSGTLDIATTDAFEKGVTAALEKGYPVAIDMSGLTLCDSIGLGAIVRLHRRALRMKREFGLRDPRPHIADLLAMTGIDKVIPVVSSRVQAD
jgi:anti-sigma B factor antagonist